MAVTLNGIDIEIITSIVESQQSVNFSQPLGYHANQITQNLHGTLRRFDIQCVWKDAANEYATKKAKLQNLEAGGPPVWFDAQEWAPNQIIFGRVSNLKFDLTEAAFNIYKVDFTIIEVFPWGYIFVQDDGAGDIRIYDNDKSIQSRFLNPIIRNCGYVKGATTVQFFIYVKNIGGSSGDITLEMMIPDVVVAGDVTITPTVTKAVGTVGTTGYSASVGTKQRITLKRTLAPGTEEQWNITITFGNGKTSFYDGSYDDVVP